MIQLQQTIRHHLADYLADVISLDQLTEVIVDAVWELAPDQHDATSDLVYTVQLSLAELSDNLVTIEQFRARMRGLLEHSTAAQPVNLRATA